MQASLDSISIDCLSHPIVTNFHLKYPPLNNVKPLSGNSPSYNRLCPRALLIILISINLSTISINTHHRKRPQVTCAVSRIHPGSAPFQISRRTLKQTYTERLLPTYIDRKDDDDDDTQHAPTRTHANLRIAAPPQPNVCVPLHTHVAHTLTKMSVSLQYARTRN